MFSDAIICPTTRTRVFNAGLRFHMASTAASDEPQLHCSGLASRVGWWTPRKAQPTPRSPPWLACWMPLFPQSFTWHYLRYWWTCLCPGPAQCRVYRWYRLATRYQVLHYAALSKVTSQASNAAPAAAQAYLSPPADQRKRLPQRPFVKQAGNLQLRRPESL